MNEQMIKTVQARATEMMQNTEIQKIMMNFSSIEAANEWLVKAAIATLITPVNER